MKVIKTSKSLFEIANGLDEAICVTTNGIVKAGGLAVMGRGVAKQCADLFPATQRLLGELLRTYGNKVFDLGVYETYTCDHQLVTYHVLTYPTKNDWHNMSDINLIIKSANEVVRLADKVELSKVYLPKVGCQNGGLSWYAEVCPAIEGILDDRFIVVFRD